MKKATVVLLIDKEGQVCLARKKQPIHHDDGAIEYSLLTYNGYGGKMESYDESILDTAIRELFDESGVTASKEDVELMMRVYFYVQKEGTHIPFMDVSFFFVRKWEGVPQEGDEMGPPLFFKQEEIPYEEMMPADNIFFKTMLRDEKGVYQVNLLGKGVIPEVFLLDEVL